MARIEQQRGYSPPGGEANLYQSSRIIAIVHTNQRRRGFNNRQIGVTHRGSISLCGTIGELPNLLHRPPGAEIVVLEGALDCIDIRHVSAREVGSRSRLIEPADLWTTQIAADDLYLPYRSLLLLSVGAAYAQAHGCTDLYAAFINSNHAHEIDCTTEFFDKLSAVLAGFGGVRVMLPYRNLTKLEVLKLALELGAPVEQTYSCQASPNVPCGACPNCVDRLEAIALLHQATSLVQ